MQLVEAVQGIIERSSIKLGFLRSVCISEVRARCEICVHVSAFIRVQ